MKKLMIALAAAATTVFAFGAGTAEGANRDTLVNNFGGWTGTSFEALTEGSVNVGDIVGKDDTGDQDGANKFWYSAATETDELGTITNEVAGAGVSRPDAFAKQNLANTKSLQIDTTSPLFRTALPNSSGVQPVDIGDGIYLDTLVKFTAADEVFGADALSNNVDKIAIEYVEREDDETTGDINEALTNFVIRAGYIATPSSISQKNYFAKVPATFNKDEWHRLTVRTFADINGSGNVGFVVYVDEVALEYDDVSEEAGVDLVATGLAAEFYTDTYRALYPSAVAGGDNKSTISSVAFSGSGSIDDVVFTTTKPDFIAVNPDVTVEWDEHVATLTLNGETVAGFVAGASGSTSVTPTSGVVSVTATFADGYVYGACVTDGNGEWSSSEKAFKNLTPGETCSIVSMLPLFKVGDEYFDNFEDALEAAVDTGTAQNPATLQLMADCNSLLTFSEGDIILDLAGFDIQGGTDADYSLINTGANLTIINTGDEASIKMPLGESSIAMYQDAAGFTTVEAGTFEGIILFNVDYDETFPQTFMLLKGGKFIDPDYAAESTFYLADCVQSGLAATYDSETGYVQVGGGEEPPAPVIPTYALTVPSVTGASAEVTSNDVVVADLTAIPSNTEVVVTWTADSGYKITAGATETITMDGNKTAATPTVVAITYATLTITPVENCTIVVSNATEEVATGAKFDEDEAVQLTVYRTPAEGYELDNCAATETITMDQDQTVTAAVKQSGGSNWPAGWNDGTEPASMAKAFDDWVAKNDPTAENAEAAFLVGVNVADYTSDLAAASISIVGGKVVITGNYDLTKINGALSVKMGDAPNALTTTTAINELTDGAISLTPALGETKKFYQLVIGYPAN